MTFQPAAFDAAPLITRTSTTASGAVVAELSPHVTAEAVFHRLAAAAHLLFLDSAALDEPADATGDGELPRLGRYSFVAVDPVHSVLVSEADAAAGISAAFATVRGLLGDLACATIPALPPFQGGVAGLVSYECGLAQLGLPTPHARAAEVPVLALHVYDVVVAFDHDAGRGWIISQGVPAQGPVARRRRATERLHALLDRLAAPPAPRPRPSPAAMASSMTGHPLPSHPHIVSTQSVESYCEMVRRGIEFVRAGDVFQVNLAQQLAVSTTVDPIDLYRRARTLNAAPFAGFFTAGDCRIVSMSPERFLQVARGTVRMHPIKGTRRMIASPEADLYAGDDLEQSAKDRAENVMIVDLVRNDLSRVCAPESVRVEALCRLERYRYVQHLVSIVSGRLRRGLTALDALGAALPGGSVTGAPKHRACEIISELEGFARGAYCGSLGYIGFDGTADFNLLIRTFVATPGLLTFAVGGGITAASDPESEHAESLHKAEGMLRVLDSFSEGLAQEPAAS